MLDLSYLTPSQSADVQIFTNPAPAAFTNWHTYNKPRGASMLYIFMFGAGAGGGGGVVATSRGGGGGSGAQATLIIPAILLPDILYIQVAAGGIGGTGTSAAPANTGGNALSHSIVSVEPSASTAPNAFLLQSGNVLATGGQGGQSAAAGTGGAGGTVGVISNNCLAGLGIFNFIAGTVGNTGSSSLGYVTTGLQCMGGGAQGFPAATNTQNYFPQVPAGTGSYNGFMSWKPFFTATGGQRDGGVSAGKNTYGCGGISGGVPNTGPVGGGGGDGGDGIVMIAAW